MQINCDDIHSSVRFMYKDRTEWWDWCYVCWNTKFLFAANEALATYHLFVCWGISGAGESISLNVNGLEERCVLRIYLMHSKSGCVSLWSVSFFSTAGFALLRYVFNLKLSDFFFSFFFFHLFSSVFVALKHWTIFILV